MNFTRLQDQRNLIGKRVTAIGCCGTKDGIEVEGILKSVDDFGAIVLITHGKRIDSQPALVNGGTLRKSFNIPSFSDESKAEKIVKDLLKELQLFNN